MIVIRFATSDPNKAEDRSRLIEEHKAYMRDSPIAILLSGPSVTPGTDKPTAALIVAEVDQFADFEAFNTNDPFVRSGVYSSVSLLEWRPTLGSLVQQFL